MNGTGPLDIWAFYLRDLLRKYCIGKRCSFYTKDDVPSNQNNPNQSNQVRRRFGYVVVEDGFVNIFFFFFFF
jgi:hypothetical protein